MSRYFNERRHTIEFRDVQEWRPEEMIPLELPWIKHRRKRSKMITQKFRSLVVVKVERKEDFFWELTSLMFGITCSHSKTFESCKIFRPAPGVSGSPVRHGAHRLDIIILVHSALEEFRTLVEDYRA